MALAKKQPTRRMLVLARDGNTVGRVVGTYRRCRLEGCTGLTYPVRWPNGKLTWLCTKGMTLETGTELWRLV